MNEKIYKQQFGFRHGENTNASSLYIYINVYKVHIYTLDLSIEDKSWPSSKQLASVVTTARRRHGHIEWEWLRKAYIYINEP